MNDKILQALERLHQDMKSVLRRLGSMEETLLSQQVGCFCPNDMYFIQCRCVINLIHQVGKGWQSGIFPGNCDLDSWPRL